MSPINTLQRRIIDFTDMIYLPAKVDLIPIQTDWVFVDEAQDLNACQLEIALRAVKPGGRLLFVGDVRQAIFGFAGADADSYLKIIARTNATELALNICYRCPKSHIEIAQRIVEEIEAAPNADEGLVKHIKLDEFFDWAEPGTLVLSRKTAPLATRCIQLIEKGVPAQVKGRDISEGLVSIIKQIVKAEGASINGGKGFAYSRFEEHLEAYEDKHVRALTKRGADDMQIEALSDKVKTILNCYLYWDAKNIHELEDKIRSMFGEDEKNGSALNPKLVNLCTVHRAKGLEAERVIIIAPGSLPLMRPNQQRWQFKQELNLKYIASTRSTKELIIEGDNPEAPSFPVKGQMDVPLHWYDQVKPHPKRLKEKRIVRWTINDWRSLADVDMEWGAESYTLEGELNLVLPSDDQLNRIVPDTDWPGVRVSNDIIIHLPNAEALREDLEQLDKTLEKLDQKERRARWRRESEVQSERFHKFCREFGRG